MVALVCDASCEELLYPDSLLNWEVQGGLHALIVDKSEQQLTVWSIGEGEPRLVDFYKCATGENEGDKQTRGDMKTPEGVYFFCSWIEGTRLPEKYGRWAFTTDYPNPVDKARGKSGAGIWLHGRDKPLAEKPDSNGCIALENSDLLKVSHYIRLQSTPLIVVKTMSMSPKSQILEQERRIRNFVDSWRSSWEARDLGRFMDHYSQEFCTGPYRFSGWKRYMKKLLQENSINGVKLGSVYLFRHGSEVTAFCNQDWKPGNGRVGEIRLLYIADAGKPRILAEEWRGRTSDPFPVGPTLAKDQAEVRPTGSAASDLQIRLVGVDEPERASEKEDAWDNAAAAANRGLPKKDGGMLRNR